MSEDFIIQPPHSMDVESEPKRVLWLPDGRALVRQIGFHHQPSKAKPAKDPANARTKAVMK